MFIEALAGLTLPEIEQRFKEMSEDDLVAQHMSQGGAIYVLGYLLEQEAIHRGTVKTLRESLQKIRRTLGKVAEERGIAIDEGD